MLLGDTQVHISQSRVVEDVGCRIPDLFHCETNPTAPLIDAVHALHIRHLADARHRRERSVQNTDDFAERDLGRRAAEKVSAAFPLLAVHHAVALELEEDRLQKLLRNPVARLQL